MRYELTDYEWAAIKPFLPNDRRVHNGIFWVLRSGASWRDLPESFGPYLSGRACRAKSVTRPTWCCATRCPIFGARRRKVSPSRQGKIEKSGRFLVAQGIGKYDELAFVVRLLLLLFEAVGIELPCIFDGRTHCRKHSNRQIRVAEVLADQIFELRIALQRLHRRAPFRAHIADRPHGESSHLEEVERTWPKLRR
jgi:transposase